MEFKPRTEHKTSPHPGELQHDSDFLLGMFKFKEAKDTYKVRAQEISKNKSLPVGCWLPSKNSDLR